MREPPYPIIFQSAASGVAGGTIHNPKITNYARLEYIHAQVMNGTAAAATRLWITALVNGEEKTIAVLRGHPMNTIALDMLIPGGLIIGPNPWFSVGYVGGGVNDWAEWQIAITVLPLDEEPVVALETTQPISALRSPFSFIPGGVRI